jgi:hypothetical protein
VVEQFGALLAPVATPVATANAAEAVEAGKDVEGVGSRHDALPSAVDGVLGIQTGHHGETHRRWTSDVWPPPPGPRSATRRERIAATDASTAPWRALTGRALRARQWVHGDG